MGFLFIYLFIWANEVTSVQRNGYGILHFAAKRVGRARGNWSVGWTHQGLTLKIPWCLC